MQGKSEVNQYVYSVNTKRYGDVTEIGDKLPYIRTLYMYLYAHSRLHSHLAPLYQCEHRSVST
jgi:hypothetical protein